MKKVTSVILLLVLLVSLVAYSSEATVGKLGKSYTSQTAGMLRDREKMMDILASAQVLNNNYLELLRESVDGYVQITTHTSLEQQKTLVHISDCIDGRAGTGVIIDYFDDYTYILTATHVIMSELRGPESLFKVVFDNGDEYTGICLAEMIMGDVGILKVKYNLEEQNEVFATPLIKESYAEISDYVYFYKCADYKNRLEFKATTVYGDIQGPLGVTAALGYHLGIPFPLIGKLPGCSGSGVFLENGAYVGLISKGNDYSAYAYSLDFIMECLKLYMEDERK